MKNYSFLQISIVVVIVSLFTSCTAYKYTTISKEEEYKIYVRMNSDAIKKFNSASELPNSVLENFSFIFCEDDEIMAEVQQRISNYFF